MLVATGTDILRSLSVIVRELIWRMSKPYGGCRPWGSKDSLVRPALGALGGSPHPNLFAESWVEWLAFVVFLAVLTSDLSQTDQVSKSPGFPEKWRSFDEGHLQARKQTTTRTSPSLTLSTLTLVSSLS